MITGLMAGVLWGLDTVILVLPCNVPICFHRTGNSLAPFVSTFLHDAFSIHLDAPIYV